MKFFQTLIPLLEKYHVKICLENLYESVGQRIAEGVCANPADAIAYIDKLNELAGKQLFGLCLDSGHLQLTHQDSYRYIQLLGNRIKLLHLHENDGIADQHQMPYSFGNGKRMGQNWKQFIMALKEIEFDGTLSFETYPCMNSFPDTMADKVLKTIYEIGEYWKTQIIGK
jgi:sugar phosphate isomerase/epimerase